ncbi:hypothetical protein GCM10008179_34840 [Hansschlegelia plantiphila]|uniref:Uncharacterized protein n=1 Tax=Hansschlegelia plantiphila TaxID=374655 RepID=A0A9W6J4V7_9HYPH|nr:hypothetical protein GCM10008179_34840 [Hansschlegelia plantiphila]
MEEEVSYTVISQADRGPVATVVPGVIDALALARQRESDAQITIAAADGWILTIEELEELAKT